MFSHVLPSMHIGIGGLFGDPPIRFGKRYSRGNILSKPFIADALENWHSYFLPEPFFGFAMAEGCLDGPLRADFAGG